MESVIKKKCKKCGVEFLETREFFGSTQSGGLRNTCRICMRKTTKKWAMQNPQGVKQRWGKRYTLLKENGGPIPFKIKEFVFLRFKGVCRYCGSYIEKRRCRTSDTVGSGWK